MRVLIDGRYWRGRFQTGVERYIHLLVDALAAIKSSVEPAIVLMCDEVESFRGARCGAGCPPLFPVPDRGAIALRGVRTAFNADLVHYPFALPAKLEAPSVFTFHDAGRLRFPELMVRAVRETQNRRLNEALKNPNLKALITVSHSSRAEITSILGSAAPPIDVVANFISPGFLRVMSQVPQRDDTPYLLGLGVYTPTKNIPRLCRAFALARAVEPQLVPERLLFVGRRGWERQLPRREPGITFLGHVPEPRLAKLYASATAFLFPSLCEGFGIPALEGLAAGCRVMCSDIPVFHEITGDLATFADPHDEQHLADGIIRTLRAEPPAAADVRSLLERYSPAAAGKALIKVYERASQ